MVCHNENQVVGPQQQRQEDTLLNAFLQGALNAATSAPDSLTPPVPPAGFALGDGEDRGDERRASLMHSIDSVLDFLDADDFLLCDEVEF
jgi:hypothetical protein